MIRLRGRKWRFVHGKNMLKKVAEITKSDEGISTA